MDIHLINRKLLETYGVDFLDQPIYHCIWSEDQIEKRFGVFTDYVPGTNILLRRVTEVREVKKYSYLDPQWVLEKLFFNQHNQEILDNKTLAPQTSTYEPVWAFGYDGKRAKQPVWRAIELLIMSINEPKRLTPSQMNDAELEEAKKDEQLMLEILNTNIKSDSLHSAVKDGDAVLFGRSTSQLKEQDGH